MPSRRVRRASIVVPKPTRLLPHPCGLRYFVFTSIFLAGVGLVFFIRSVKMPFA